MPKSLSAAAAPIKLSSKIHNSSYRIKLAERMGEQAQRDVDEIVAKLQRGYGETIGIGPRFIGNNMWELRGKNGGRVIIHKNTNQEISIVAKFQAHQKGDDKYSDIIKKIMEDYKNED